MKTLIVGTGIIGVIYGWALSEAGVDVTHFVRKGKTDQFRKGVDLDLLDERKGHPPKKMYHYAMKCTDTISLSLTNMSCSSSRSRQTSWKTPWSTLPRVPRTQPF